MGFKEDFLKTPPGPAREALVYNEVIKRGPPKNLVPVTVNGPANTKITYQVMPDYVMVDGVRVPMSGTTAQRVADYFGMKLPTTKMSKQIYDAADTKIMPTPLSSGGVIGGKYYSGQEVVNSKISDSDSSIAYNQLIDQQLQKEKGTPTLVAGHMKDVVQPPDPNKLGLYGWYDKNGKPIQHSAYTPHDIKVHTEYGAGTRLVSDQVTVTTADGRTITTTMDKLLNNPNFSKAVAVAPGTKRYNTTSSPVSTPAKTPSTELPVQPTNSQPQAPKVQSGRMQLLQRIENFLNRIMGS
jgi:hypothetical protein